MTPKEGSSSQNAYLCEIHGLVLRSILQLAQHHRRHRGQKPHTCEGQFYFAADLQWHQRQHIKEISFRSDMGRASLMKSCMPHVSGSPSTCKEVGKGFLASMGFPHQEATREKTSSSNKCAVAFHNGKSHHHWGERKKAFSHTDALVRDQRGLAREGPHVCSECGKFFTCCSSFIIHQSVHTGERPRACSGCGKAFRQIYSLSSHRKVHTGGRPYTCGECGKPFSHSSNLKSHQSVHTGERPYECRERGKSFSQSSKFIQHGRIHTGKRPYRCSECGKS